MVDQYSCSSFPFFLFFFHFFLNFLQSSIFHCTYFSIKSKIPLHLSLGIAWWLASLSLFFYFSGSSGIENHSADILTDHAISESAHSLSHLLHRNRSRPSQFCGEHENASKLLFSYGFSLGPPPLPSSRSLL